MLLTLDPGNGGGNGNRYGLAASYAVIILPVMFVRLFAPPQYLPGVVLGTVRTCTTQPLPPSFCFRLQWRSSQDTHGSMVTCQYFLILVSEEMLLGVDGPS